MAEFKKLSEVEQIETASDNATVLVEEGGEIKRVPKKEVGGAGGYYLTLTYSNCEISDENPEILCNENYDKLYDVLIAGGTAWFDFGQFMGLGTIKPLVAAASFLPIPTNRVGWMCQVSNWQITDVGLFATFPVEGNLYFTICFPNGSHNLEPGDR